jgi:hypothetical protein
MGLCGWTPDSKPFFDFGFRNVTFDGNKRRVCLNGGDKAMGMPMGMTLFAKN